ELPADQIMREVQIPGAWPQLSTGADGVIRCSSNNCEMLVGALPLQRGVLVVMPSPWCTAHWRAYGSLTVDEIRSAIKALQRLPPPSESTDEIAAGAGY